MSWKSRRASAQWKTSRKACRRWPSAACRISRVASLYQLVVLFIEPREVLAGHTLIDGLREDLCGQRRIGIRFADLIREGIRHREVLGEVRHCGAPVEFS